MIKKLVREYINISVSLQLKISAISVSFEKNKLK